MNNININNTLLSPLEQFEVNSFIAFNAPILGNFVLSITNLGLYAIISVSIVIFYHIFSFKRVRKESTVHSTNNVNGVLLIGNKWSASLESSYASLHNMVKEQIGRKNEVYLPFIYSLFFFILISNLAGNVPYNFAIGTSAVLSLGLRFTIFLAVTILGLSIHGIHFFSYFVPFGTPLALVPLLVLIEIISYLARAFSLGVRLFANLVAGHTLLKILSGFLYPALTRSILLFFVTLLPIRIFICLVGLEIAVSLIQAYVFTILTAIYLKDSIYLH